MVRHELILKERRTSLPSTNFRSLAHSFELLSTPPSLPAKGEKLAKLYSSEECGKEKKQRVEVFKEKLKTNVSAQYIGSFRKAGPRGKSRASTWPIWSGGNELS